MSTSEVGETLIEQLRRQTREAWEEEWFKKIWELALLEVEVASKKGRFGTTIVYQDKAKAQAVAARLKEEGIGVNLHAGKGGEKFSNYYLNINWGPETVS